MKEYSITEQFSLIALNGQDSKHETQAKKAAILGIAVANTLHHILFSNDAEPNPAQVTTQLEEQIRKIKKMNKKARQMIEKKITDQLKAEGVLKEIPNLLGCDMNYYTADITMREYKSDEHLYQKIVESVRAMILEPGEIPVEVISLLWLFRECGCMHDVFSIEEQIRVQERLIELSAENSMYRTILEQEFHKGVNQTLIKFLKWKHNLFKNPYLEGVNLFFPFLDRKQAVFIDMVIFDTSVKDRRQAAIQFLCENGHSCEEVKVENETLVKIDNSYYRIFPTVRQCRLPIQGIMLLPAYK